MNRIFLSSALLVATLGLAACNRDKPEGSEEVATEVATSLVDDVTRDIREEFAKENIPLGHRDNLPRAELSPQGDLLIDGRKVAMDATQRELALAYRNEIARVAETGARLGLQGADLAREAMTEAASSLFDKNAQSVEERLKDSTDRIKAEARALCDSLPKLMAAQDAFAQAVPEFAPYADMDQADIDDCGDDIE